MTTPVEPEHLNEYIGRYYEKTVSEVTSDDLLFEALSEMIVEMNPELTVEELAEEFNGQDEYMTLTEFVTQRFHEVVHDDTMDVISYAHRNKWIEYTEQGLLENGAESKQ